MISYGKLWLYLAKNNKKKTDLLEFLSPSTVAKLSKNANVNTDTIDKICKNLKCTPNDILEYIDEEQIDKKKEELDNTFKTLINLMNIFGDEIPEEQKIKMQKELMEKFPEMMKDSNFKLENYIDTKK